VTTTSAVAAQQTLRQDKQDSIFNLLQETPASDFSSLTGKTGPSTVKSRAGAASGRPQLQKCVKKNTRKGRKNSIDDNDSSGEDNNIFTSILVFFFYSFLQLAPSLDITIESLVLPVKLE